MSFERVHTYHPLYPDRNAEFPDHCGSRVAYDESIGVQLQGLECYGLCNCANQ